MRERMQEHRELDFVDRARAEAPHAPLVRAVAVVELGQAVEPAPDPALRTPLEEHASFGVADDAHRAPPLWPLALRPRRRHARLDPEPASGAALLDRTDRARGTTAHAEHRAEI